MSINALSSSLTWCGLIRNGDLSVTSISTSILGQVQISSLKLNVSLYSYSISITSFFSSLVKHDLSRSMYFSNISLSAIYLHLSFGSNHGYLSSGAFCSFFLQCVYKFVKVFTKLFCSFKFVISTQVLL